MDDVAALEQRVRLRVALVNVVLVTACLGFCAAVCLTAAVAVAADPSEEGATRVWLPLVLGVGGTACLIPVVRLPRFGVVLDHDGVDHRSWYRTQRWPWAEIDGAWIDRARWMRGPSAAVWLRIGGSPVCLGMTGRFRGRSGDEALSRAFRAVTSHPGFVGRVETRMPLPGLTPRSGPLTG